MCDKCFWGRGALGGAPVRRARWTRGDTSPTRVGDVTVSRYDLVCTYV